MLALDAPVHRPPCRGGARVARRAPRPHSGGPRAGAGARPEAPRRRRPARRDPDQPAPSRARDREGPRPGRERAGRAARAGGDRRRRPCRGRGARRDRGRRRPPAGLRSRPRAVDEVLDLVGLDDKRDARVRTLSGGQKRRLDLGIALVGDPQLVFLDEPTTGFDPAARRTAWEMIRSLRSLGKTVLLTTHYLDEAQQLSDRVAVLREGRIVTIGAPSVLIGGSVAAEIRYRRNGEQVVQRTTEPTRVLHELTAAALARGEELEGLEVRRPSLEDVYLSLVEEPEAGGEA